MRTTRVRDLAPVTGVAAVLSLAVISLVYGAIPPIPALAGLSLFVLAVIDAGLGVWVRRRIADENGIGQDDSQLHPILVLRFLVLGRATAFVGALFLGVAGGFAAYILPRRGDLSAAAADTPGILVALLGAALAIAAGLWLEHGCKAPPSADAEGADTAGEELGRPGDVEPA